MKKILSFTLVIIYLFLFASECYAYDYNSLEVEYFEEYCDEYSGQEVFSSQMPDYFYKFENGGIACSSYALLSDIEKTFYDKIVSLNIGELSFSFNYSPALTKTQYESINFTKIMYAICLDHPEIFYYNGYQISRSYYPSTGAVSKINYTIASKKHGQTNAAIYTASNIPGYYNSMLNAINSVDFNTDSRYDFVKSVHDYLCQKITYVNDYASCHDAYGALVNNEAVCQGYAETFKIFCDIYKIPCVCLSGTANGGAHMWNAVQMDDGLWYILDLTWDDQESYGIFTDFFLIGLQTKDKYFTGQAFYLSHVSDGSPYLPALNYAQTAYNSAQKFSSFGATFNSNELTVERKLILSYFDAEENNVYYNGIYVPVNSYKTSAEISVYDASDKTNTTWQIVLIGDTNCDGVADNSDYSIAVNKALEGTVALTNVDLACDANCDGVIDAVDVTILERAINGSNKNIIISE